MGIESFEAVCLSLYLSARKELWFGRVAEVWDLKEIERIVQKHLKELDWEIV